MRLTGKAEADRTQAIGLAEAKATEALGLARATGFEAQRAAIGEVATALVAVAGAIADGQIDIMPDVLVTGGGGSFEGLAATLMQAVRNTMPRMGAAADGSVEAEVVDEAPEDAEVAGDVEVEATEE